MTVGNRLPNEKIEAMWQAFQERQAADFVSRKCGVHWKTVERYRRIERWDERLREVKSKAQVAADTSLASAMAESLKLVRSYKLKVADALSGKLVAPEEITAGELEKLVKLEAFILGGVESRSEVVGRFDHLTDDQLEAYARDGNIPR